MKRLFKTTRNGVNNHWHYFYYEDDLAEFVNTGVDFNVELFTAIEEDHPHPVRIQLVDDLETITANLLVIDEADGHRHEIDEEIPHSETTEINIERENDHVLIGRVRDQWTSAFAREELSQEAGALSEDMYVGRQWIDDSRRDIEPIGKNRSKITVNLLQANTNLLLGNHRQNRTDLKFLATEGSDELIADVLSAIAKIELKNNNYEFEEIQVVEDQLVTGRGNFIIWVDFDTNVLGDIKVERVPWRQVVYGEHEKYTADDAEFVGMSDYMTKSDIDARWGDEVEGLNGTLNAFEERFERERKEDHAGQNSKGQFFDHSNKTFRVIETWTKEFAKVWSIIQPDDGFVATSDTKFSQIGQLNQFGFKQINRKKAYIRHQIFAGGEVLLEDEVTDIDEIPIVPVYYDKRGDRFWSKVSLGIDLQRFYNKLLSKVSEYVNKFVSSTHFFDSNTFPSPNTDQTEQVIAVDLEQPGAMVEVQDISNVPQPMLNSPLPAPVFALLGDIRDLIQASMNLNPAFLGERTAESGIKVLRDKQQAQLGNEKHSDNLGLSKKRLGKMVAKNIQLVYTPDRVMRLLSGNSVEGQEFNFGDGRKQVMERAFTPQELEEIGRRFNDQDLTKLDVTVAQSPYTPTTMIANYMMMVESMQTGQFPIPPEALIEINPFIDHKNKQKVLKFIAEARAAEAQSQQAERDAQQKRTETAGQLDLLDTLAKQQGKQGNA